MSPERPALRFRDRAGSAHFDLDLPGLGALSYRQIELQDAILELSLDLFRVNLIADLELTEEVAQFIFTVDRFPRNLVLSLCLNCQRVVVDVNLEVFLRDPGRSAIRINPSRVS